MSANNNNDQSSSSSRDGHDESEEYDESESSAFIPIYEQYLSDKTIIERPSQHSDKFKNNAQKALKEWFENEGLEFKIKEDQPGAGKFTATIDLPVDEHEFEVSSELHDKKQTAIDEVCLHACWLLDESGLLYNWLSDAQNEIDRRRRIGEAIREDDIEYDNTVSRKRQRETSESDYQDTDQQDRSKPKVNTYDSLMADWNKLNMSILKLKAELVKLDVELANGKTIPRDINDEKANEGEDEIDPLDAYMSSLEEQKRKPSLDDKIEKSRLKTQISSLEREQARVSKLIELAKPTFDLNKACPLQSSSHSKTSK